MTLLYHKLNLFLLRIFRKKVMVATLPKYLTLPLDLF